VKKRKNARVGHVGPVTEIVELLLEFMVRRFIGARFMGGQKKKREKPFFVGGEADFGTTLKRKSSGKNLPSTTTFNQARPEKKKKGRGQSKRREREGGVGGKKG